MATRCSVTYEFLKELRDTFGASSLKALYAAELEELDELIDMRVNYISPRHELQLLRAFCLLEWVVEVVVHKLAAAERLDDHGVLLLGKVGPTVSRSHEGLTQVIDFAAERADELELMEADARLSGGQSAINAPSIGQKTSTSAGVRVFTNNIAANLQAEIGTMTNRALFEYIIVMARTIRSNLAGPSVSLGVVGRTAVEVLARVGLLTGSCMPTARALLDVTEEKGTLPCQRSTMSLV